MSSHRGSSFRVLLAKPRGFCAGVERAIEIVERALALYGPPVYVRHEIVHNKHVVELLRAQGAVFVEELDEIPEGAVTIFSAHGVSTEVEDEAERRNLPVIDATCPLVTKVHKEGRNHARKGREVILIGHAGHPEVEGTQGRIPGGVHLVSSTDDVRDIAVRDSDQGRLRHPDHTQRRRYPRHHRSPPPAFPEDHGTRRQGHLLRDAKPPAGGSRTRGARRHASGGGCPQQLELELAARDRRGIREYRVI